jgi:four helix bundle protein
MVVNSYRDLIVWQKSVELSLEVYSLTAKFPKTEIYGIVSQMRRCAVSIPSNIAEGRTRNTRKDFRQFLIVAMASGAELETQLTIAKKLGFGSSKDYQNTECLLLEVMKMLNKMISSLE